MKIKQITFNEAMELAKTETPVYVIATPGKPVIKSFRNLSIGEAVGDNGKYIFVVFEEAVESGRA